MSTPSNKPTKQERKDAARAERQAAEQAAAAQAARKRRLGILGGVVGLAAVVIVVIVVASGSGGSSSNTTSNASSSPAAAVSGAKESRAMLAGIPQQGKVLGNPKAPVTMLEFADLQCPFCRDYTLQTLPRVVQDYVRAGKVKLELHLLTFLGDDSVRGAAVANAAAKQNKLWNFADLFYYNQGEEKTGYATDAFLRKLMVAVPGADVAQVFAHRTDGDVIAQNGAANSLASRYGVTGTPTFVVGPSGGTLKTVDGFDYNSVKSALDSALQQG